MFVAIPSQFEGQHIFYRREILALHTIRNTTTAILKELLANLQEQQRRQIRRMSRRLSLFTDLQKYKLPEPPRWRIHNFNDPEAVLFARDYPAALNYGDSGGNAFYAARLVELSERLETLYREIAPSRDE